MSQVQTAALEQRPLQSLRWMTSDRFDALLAVRTDGARRQAREAVEQGRRHDLRSALFVVDGAAEALARRHDDLDEAGRLALRDVMTAGLARVHALVDERIEELGLFAVGPVIRSVVHTQRRAGRAIAMSAPDDLRLVGRATDLAVVLGTLLDEAAAASTVASASLLCERRGDAVVFDIEPDAPRLELVRASAHALDLYVATRLVVDQGGELSTAGPGAYVVRLPATDDGGDE